MPCDTRPVILAHVPAGGAPGLMLAPHTYLGRDVWLRYAAHTGALKYENQTRDGGRKGQLGGLEQAARAVAKLQADGMVFLQGDQNVPFDKIVDVLVALKQAQISDGE